MTERKAGDFSVGDVVVLKGGGPKMTITSFSRDASMPTAYCEWFSSDNNVNMRRFPLAALKIAE